MLRNIIAVCLLTFATGKILFYDVLLEPSQSCLYIFQMFNLYMFLNFMQKLKTMYIWYIRFKIYLNTADMSCALIYVVFNKFFISLCKYIQQPLFSFIRVYHEYFHFFFFIFAVFSFSFSFFIYIMYYFPFSLITY